VLHPGELGVADCRHQFRSIDLTLNLPFHVCPNATLQARGIAGARHEQTLFPVALQAFVRCFARADEEIRWDAQVYSQSLNLWK